MEKKQQSWDPLTTKNLHFLEKNEKMKHLDLLICFEIPMRLLLIPEEQLHKISALNPSN